MSEKINNGTGKGRGWGWGVMRSIMGTQETIVMLCNYVKELAHV